MSSKTLIPIALLALAPTVLLSTDANANSYRPFCGSHTDACEYTGPNAPVLRADVCWDGTQAVLKVGSCPTNSWPYYVDYGEVLDPLTSVVQPYIPLDWACDHPGICKDGPAPQQASAVPICCEGGECYPLANGGCAAGADKVLCKSGVSNENGTVTCFEEEALP